MSLPAYSPKDQEEGAALLRHADTYESGEDGAGHPSYPPASGSAPPPAPPGPSREALSRMPNIKYTFGPRYPMLGAEERYLGKLGSTRAETIAIIQRGIPRLRSIPEHRFEFLVLQPEQHYQVWCAVMEDAWDRFDQDAPSSMFVRLADEPGDIEARTEWQRQKTRRKLRIAAAILVPISVTVFALFLVLLGPRTRGRG